MVIAGTFITRHGKEVKIGDSARKIPFNFGALPKPKVSKKAKDEAAKAKKDAAKKAAKEAAKKAKDEAAKAKKDAAKASKEAAIVQCICTHAVASIVEAHASVGTGSYAHVQASCGYA